MQRFHNRLTAEMRESHMSRLSPGRIFSLWDVIASFNLKSLWAQGRAWNLGCPPAQGSQQHHQHGAAVTCDQTMTIMWGPLIWHPLDEMANLQLTSGFGSSPHFQPAFIVPPGWECPPRHGECSEVTSSPGRWTPVGRSTCQACFPHKQRMLLMEMRGEPRL